MQFQNRQMVKAPFASAEGWITTQLYYSKGSEDAEYKALIQRESIWWQCHNRQTKEDKTKTEILCSTEIEATQSWEQVDSEWCMNI